MLLTDTSLSIIIVNWNTCALLTDCLNAIGAHPPSAPVEVWVVDNASADGSADRVRAQFPEIKLIENRENRGFARANNQAVVQCSGDYILFLNSDAFVQADTLNAMLALMEAQPGIGALGPRLLNPDGSFQASYAKFPTLWSEWALLTGLARWTVGSYAPSPRPTPGERAHAVDWVPGAALMVRRATLAQVGNLDEAYFMYSEETDLCWRMRQAGWEVWYLPEAVVTHIGGASSRQRSTESYIQLYRSKLRFLRRAYGGSYAALAQVVLFVTVALRYGLWVCLSLFPTQRGRWAARRRQVDGRLLWALTSQLPE